LFTANIKAIVLINSVKTQSCTVRRVSCERCLLACYEVISLTQCPSKLLMLVYRCSFALVSVVWNVHT